MLNRRQFTTSALGGFFAFSQLNRAAKLFASESKPNKQTQVLVLWMDGGPSQFETFDPKPGASTGGPTKAIATDVAGIQIAEHLPNIARHMSKFSVLRNLTSKEGAHERGQYYMHTGFRPVPGFPRPSLGSVASHYATDNGMPNYVTINSRGFGPAFMGSENAPFSIDNPESALQLMNRLKLRRSRLKLLEDFSADFDRRHPSDVLNQRHAMVERVGTLLTTPFVEALDLTKEKRSTRERYGETEFGSGCLLARRMLSAGVRFVEVQLGGWDTHTNNFRECAELCGQLDKPWSALMEDLQASGLLKNTVVLWLGEFGRTPRINAQRGRDHFPLVTSAVIGGGGVSTGQVIGQTNKRGTKIEGDSVSVADLFATLFKAIGVNPEAEFTTDFGSPTTATDDGVVIDQLLG